MTGLLKRFWVWLTDPCCKQPDIVVGRWKHKDKLGWACLNCGKTNH